MAQGPQGLPGPAGPPGPQGPPGDPGIVDISSIRHLISSEDLNQYHLDGVEVNFGGDGYQKDDILYIGNLGVVLKLQVSAISVTSGEAVVPQTGIIFSVDVSPVVFTFPTEFAGEDLEGLGGHGVGATFNILTQYIEKEPKNAIICESDSIRIVNNENEYTLDLGQPTDQAPIVLSGSTLSFGSLGMGKVVIQEYIPLPEDAEPDVLYLAFDPYTPYDPPTTGG